MCLYLTKRGSTYYFRRAIPIELRPAFDGNAEFIFSLRTKDREDAKRKRPLEEVRTTRLLDDARAALTGAASAPRAASEPARAITEDQLAQMEHESRVIAGKDARREEVSGLISFLEERLKGSTQEMPPELRAYRYIIEGREFDMELLRDQLTIAKAERRELQERLAALSPQPCALRPGNAPQSGSDAVPSAVPLLTTFDAYAAAQGVKPGTVVEWRARIADLITFLGHDDAARLSVEDVHRWREHLLSETVRGGKRRDPRTVRSTYLSALRATLAWAVEERKLPTNVATSVTVRVPRKAKLRQPDFTMDEATRILRAALAPDPALSPERAFARRWIPWLCAYSGARVNEFSQLRREDVHQVDGTWVVRITPEAGQVKANVARTVPLHSHLIEQGFLAAVEAKTEGPLFYDPGRQRAPGNSNRHFKKVGERLAQWVRGDVGITDPNVQPNHGWRHMFKTLAMAANMPERVADYIQGHAPRSVGRTYGSVPLSALVAAIESLPRFDVKPHGSTAS